MSRCIVNRSVIAKDPIRSGVRTSREISLLGNHRRCYPLTLSDNFSRYLLLCRALEHPSYQAVRPWLEWAFREYGLPEAIRTDNGAPFASLAIGGVSELSKWWIELGIRPSGSNRESLARTDVMNGCIEPLSRMSRNSQRTGANRTVLIFSWSSITEESHMPPFFKGEVIGSLSLKKRGRGDF